MSPRVSVRLLSAQSDQRLVELARQGHERAFEAVVQRYRRPLLRYCGRMGLSDARAEDVLQHALLQAWLALGRGVEVRELKPWLYRIVHNTAVNAIRRAPQDHGPFDDAAHVDSSVEAEAVLERRIAVRDALSDVAALPQMQREAILLTAVDGRSHEEVASELGISHGAVRGLLYRARATLRAAAAAVAPQPLINWANGLAGRVTPATERLAELSAPGGAAGMTGTLMKGAALAVTAALAAGAVLVPLHRHPTHSKRSASRPVALTSAETLSVAASPPSISTAGAVSVGRGSIHPASIRGASAPSHATVRSAPASRGASPIAAANGAPPTIPSRVGSIDRPAGHGSEGGSSSGASGGGSGSDGTHGSEVGGQSDGGRSGTEGASGSGSSGTNAGGGQEKGSDGAHEREAEAAHETAEREAEAARELREREAEAAQERAEREAEAANEAKAGKGS